MHAGPSCGRERGRLANLGQVLQSAIARLEGCSETPRLDAEVLLSHVLGRNRAYLRAWPERRLMSTQVEHYTQLVEKRTLGQPIAYLTGEREFWSRPFAIRPGVLIPRPETELLIELALRIIPVDLPAEILDLGTGSGIIAVTLAAERPLARVIATDISPDALETARKNASRIGTENISFRCGDWFGCLNDRQHFDLVISNPPYIAEEDPHLEQGDLRFEPEPALKSGPDGLDALRAIAEGARHRLKAGGCLALEHGYHQAASVTALLAEFGYSEISNHRDLQGHFRAATAHCP